MFDSIVNNSEVLSAIIALIASVFVAFINYFLLKKRWRRELRIAENKIFDEHASTLVKVRIGPYADFMKGLSLISSNNVDIGNRNSLTKNVEQLKSLIQAAIYGKIGLIASHETRESILILRVHCANFIKNQIAYDELKMSSWKVHQLLRSDLGLAQPGLESAIEKSRSKQLAGKENEILNLLDSIHHNKWEEKLMEGGNTPTLGK